MKSILFKFYVPFEANKDITKVKDILEEGLGIKLDYEINQEGEVIPLKDHLPFFQYNPLTYNSRQLVTVDPNRYKKVLLSRFVLEKGFQYANTKLWYILMEFDYSYIGHSLFELFNHLAIEMNAYWAKSNSSEIEGIINLQHLDTPEHANTYGLPKLFEPKDFESPKIPANLGWMNYWSKEPAEQSRISDPSVLPFFDKFYFNDEGSFAFKLTKELLSISNDEHILLIKNLYDRFPIIGNRHKT